MQTLTRARTYVGHAGVLLFTPHADELADPAAQQRWWDVYDFGYADGVVEGRRALQAELDAATKAEWERMEAARQAIARSKDQPLDALSEIRGEPKRGAAIRAYWQQIGLDRSPYREMKEEGLLV